MVANNQFSSLLWHIDINFMLKVVTHFYKNRGLSSVGVAQRLSIEL